MDGSAADHAPGEDWLQPMRVKLGQLSPLSSSCTIFRVPSKLRTMNVDAYKPQIVSIGPLHHESVNFPSMEHEKLHYMLSLLERTQRASQILDDCGRAILDNDGSIRACYAEQIKYSRDELAEIMLLDGCFLIELFLRYCFPGLRFQNDPIFATSWMLLTIQRDLALLENQIPFFVLESLFNLTVRHSALGASVFPLPQLALQFFKRGLNISEETVSFHRQSGHHLLHLIHNCYLPHSPSMHTREKGALEVIHCATALHKAGIKFKSGTAKNLLDLRFEKGVFRIPQLSIHDSTDSLFRNLMAFEQCFCGSTQYITSYVFLMDRLIDTASDVELLERKKIIQNNLGGGEDVSALFNKICKQIALQDFYFQGLCEKVNAYYNKPWHRYKATLKRDYFRNPWTITSLIAGFALLSLTLLQTIYTVLSYYHQQS
uniref:UPF0481 protein At3g47200-like isoform X1 n=1 Tax=Rhizophora mucronata TaxID=61149 RepID=A0A2P2IX97_RHIMU